MKIGQVCVKTCGRDAGKRGIVIGIKENKILLDGEIRRRTVSMMHVVPTEKTVNIKEDASHEEVKQALKTIGITIKDKKPKKTEQKTAETPKKETKSNKTKKQANI